MCLKHGVLYRSDRNRDEVAFLFDNRDMLFAGSIGGVRCKSFHFFTAANATDTGVMKVCDNISAMFTFVNRHSFLLVFSF